MPEPPAFVPTQLQSNIWRVVENDKFSENPIMYIILASKYTVLIDTGVNSANYLEFLLSGTIPEDKLQTLPFLVINTHNHFDHIGANYIFSPKNSPKHPKCVQLCAGSADKSYTLNFPETTLSATVGAHSNPYTVTKWLEDDDVIPLHDSDPNEVLKVLHLPGHTPDSIGLYYPKARLFFAGDFIYPYSAILLNLPHSSFHQYVESLYMLMQFLKAQVFENIRICCGHNDSDLPASDLVELWALVENVLNKTADCKNKMVYGMPCNVYSSDKFELLVNGAVVKNIEKLLIKVASKFERKRSNGTSSD